MNRQDATNAERLLRQSFGPDVRIVGREKMDVDWAPVERWHIQSLTEGSSRSVVVKTRRHGEAGWGGHPMNLVAERRALTCLNNSPHTPNLYAYDDGQGVIIMEDIYDAVTVEKLLFGSDGMVAIDALIAMARSVGTINGSTAGMPDELWNPEVSVWGDPVSSWATVRHLLDIHGFAEVDIPEVEIPEIDRLVRMDSMRSLTHWDVTPGNALRNGERIVVIDFEAANPRHMAVDGAAFSLGFSHYRYWAPLSDEIVDAMRDAWIEGVTAAWSKVPDRDVMLQHLAAAAVCKTIERLTRLERIADPDQSRASAVRRRSQIVDSIRRATRCCDQAAAFPGLAHGFSGVEAQMRERWPETDEALRFPAFNAGNRNGWAIYHPV